MSKQMYITIDLTVPDGADPDSVGGWVFDLLAGQETDLYETVDNYDTALAPA